MHRLMEKIVIAIVEGCAVTWLKVRTSWLLVVVESEIPQN